jgi:carboxyl-terminal processing protease
VYLAKGNALAPKIPMVVLVDRGTASAAEIVTGALEDRGRAKVVGTHTYGKGVFQEIEPLPNGGALDITVGEYFTPSGRNLGGGGVREGAGIAPNIHALDNPHTKVDEALQVAERTVAGEVR